MLDSGPLRHHFCGYKAIAKVLNLCGIACGAPFVPPPRTAP
jgi:hypothetical protein